MRQSRIEKARAANTEVQPTRAAHNLEAICETILDGRLSETQRSFIFSPERVGWFVGPYGSGKTGAAVCAVVLPCLIYPNSKWFVARSTYWTLQETTLQDFEKYISRLGPNIIVDRQKGPPYKVWVASGLRKPDGRPEEPSEVIFHSLDDMEKLGSTQFSGIVVDEANEIDQATATTLNGRLRWKREGYEQRPGGPFFLRFVSNAVRRSHWLHRQFCGQDTDGDDNCEKVPFGKKFRSKPMENAHNLPPGYYTDIAKGMTPEQKLRFVEGACGPDPQGEGVYPEFNPSIHVGDFKFDPSFPLIRGWDFGRRRPACVFSQLIEDRLVRLAAMLGNEISLERFIDRVFQRTAMQMGGARTFYDFVDPHGNQRRDVSEETSISIMQKRGMNPRWRDVAVNTGLELVSKNLTTITSKGLPAAAFDRANCSLLIEAYQGGYCWPKPTALREVGEVPFKDGTYEHPADADRYINVCLKLGPTADHSQHRRILRRVRSSVTGW